MMMMKTYMQHRERQMATSQISKNLTLTIQKKPHTIQAH